MTYRVAVETTSGSPIGTLVWAEGQFPNLAEGGKEAAIIENILRLRWAELARVHFMSDSSPPVWVRGWQGYDGTIGAARLALAAVGMRLTSNRRAKV